MLSLLSLKRPNNKNKFHSGEKLTFKGRHYKK